VAAGGIYAVGSLLFDRQVGIVLALLWGALPHAVVQSMGYSESLFTALCAWSLFALLRRSWMLAGGLALLAGLTRATGIALIAAVGLACLVAIVRRADGWRAWVGAALAPLGFLVFMGFCAVKLHRVDGYFWVQSVQWHNRTDFGLTTWRMLTDIAARPHLLGLYVTSGVLIVSVLLLVLLAAERRVAWPLIVFAGAMVAIALVQGGGYYYSKARYLMPAFPLLIPAALALCRATPLARRLVLACVIGFSAWYGAYLCLQWPISP
jgi:hypothetical protein